MWHLLIETYDRIDLIKMPSSKANLVPLSIISFIPQIFNNLTFCNFISYHHELNRTYSRIAPEQVKASSKPFRLQDLFQQSQMEVVQDHRQEHLDQKL